MRRRKIRGHNRKQREIERWKNVCLNLDLDRLNMYQYNYAKIMVHPWCDISIIDSGYLEPTKKTKQRILESLLDIYISWKKQLDKIEKPYYLKVWLYEPRFSRSQVVCAIGDKIEYYESQFFKPDLEKEYSINSNNSLSKKLQAFKWSNYLDEDQYDHSFVGDAEQYSSISDYRWTEKWFKKLMQKPHRTINLSEPIDDVTEYYAFKKGIVWIGCQ